MGVRVALLVLLAAPAFASGPSRPNGEASQGGHFPQKVLVRDLIGHKLVAPRESQTLLGRVEAVERRADGTLALRVRTWSLLPWSGRSVSVPLAAVSFLGPQVALTGLSETELAALPATPASTAVEADQTIELGITKPFH